MFKRKAQITVYVSYFNPCTQQLRVANEEVPSASSSFLLSSKKEEDVKLSSLRGFFASNRNCLS